MFLFNHKDKIKKVIVCTLAVGLAACSQQIVEEPVDNPVTSAQAFHDLDVNTHALNKVVCDPMGGSGNPSLHSGLIAELFYLESDQPRYNNVQSYIDEGTQSSQKLFFSDLNVPTRMFDTGFPAETGQLVQNDEGDDLIEYFALRFKSVLQLSPEDMEGEYELALLSDDGSILRFINIDGEEQLVVDNDGDHPTRMGCGETVHFDYDTSFDVRLDYYQGPRYHISLIPMWRRVDQSTTPEKECGKQGNNRFFDFNNGSSEQPSYVDMLLRGWRPIAAENWHLPPSSVFNPCVEGTNPIISNFSVTDIGEAVAIINWTTDIPATSQVLWTTSDGTETMTVSDNVLRTEHQIVIDDGIEFDQTYTFQGLSISGDMGKTFSRVLEEEF